jgi:hypothetical protein
MPWSSLDRPAAYSGGAAGGGFEVLPVGQELPSAEFERIATAPRLTGAVC